MLVRRLLALTFAIWIALTWGCDNQREQAAPEVRILPVSAIQIQCQDSYSYPVTYYGRVEPAREVALSFELLGQIEEILVDEGGTVQEGEVVARLDTSLLEADRAVLLARRKAESSVLKRLQRGERDEVIAAAEAVVKRLEVEVRRTEAEKIRAENVYADRAISKSDYDEALYAYHSAVYQLEQARQRLDELESGSREEDIEAQESRVAEVDAELERLAVQFDKSVLKAPFDAVCIRRFQDEGATIAAGQNVVEIYESKSLEARFSIPYQAFKRAAEAAHIEIEGHHRAVADARVVSKVDEMMRSVDVVMTLPIESEPSGPVFPGQTCTLVLPKQQDTDCVELPVTSLVASVRGLWSCYRLVPVRSDDQEQVGEVYAIEKVDLAILFTDGKHAIASSVLNDGDLVVSEGVHRLVPGTLVRIPDEGEG